MADADETLRRIRELRDYGSEDDEISEVSIMKVGTLKMNFDSRSRGLVAKALVVLILAAAVSLLIIAWRWHP